MVASIEDRIHELGLVLPVPPESVANYVATCPVGNLLFVSGQLCLGSDGKPVALGKLGEEISVEDGQRAAKAAAVNLVAQVKAAVGHLDRVKKVVRLGGFIASSGQFTDHAKVMNGASDLMVTIFGEAGRHTRSTVGVASLPLGVPVEVEGLFEIEAES